MTPDEDKRRRVAKLVDLIEIAFDKVQYPGDDNLVYNNSPQHVSCRSVRERFSGLHWRRIPLDFIPDSGSDLLFMTPAALKFYLPALMIAGLTHEQTLWSLHADLVDLFSRPENLEQRFGGLTREQRAAVAEFVRYSLTEFEDDLGDVVTVARSSLSSFWEA